MANLNKVFLIGNVTRDIDLRSTKGGQSIANFGMAINRRYAVEGEKKEEVTFVELTAWGKGAETLAQYVKKGDPLMVEGRLHFSTWEDKEGGKRSKLDVTVENFQFLGGKKDGDEKPSKSKGKSEEPDYGDVPF